MPTSINQVPFPTDWDGVENMFESLEAETGKPLSYHITTSDIADRIEQEGFKPGMHGFTYFADSPTKLYSFRPEHLQGHDLSILACKLGSRDEGVGVATEDGTRRLNHALTTENAYEIVGRCDFDVQEFRKHCP